MNEIMEVLKEIDLILEGEDFNQLSVLRCKLAILMARLSSELAIAQHDFDRQFVEIRKQHLEANPKVAANMIEHLQDTTPEALKKNQYELLFENCNKVIRTTEQRIEVLLVERNLTKISDGGN